ncbi:hypothetical protein N7540_000875 [Penicillium herquei]|nr:hypothetical protein N7540_000875 [Penicillium herquei]
MGKRMSLHPDLDDLFVANPESVSGVTDGQRTGSSQPMQLQAWLYGPSESGEACALLTNLGENPGHGGYPTATTGAGAVSVTLGLTGSSYTVEWVWYGNKTTVASGGRYFISKNSDHGESEFLRLIPA